MDAQRLQRLGLTQNESIVYVTLLKIGPSKATAILNSSGLNSGKIYEIIESLKRKGLVSETKLDGARVFTAASPQLLSHLLATQEQQLIDDKKYLDMLLPQLTSLHNATVPQKRIVTYTGFEGIRSAARELLELLAAGEEIVSYGISDVNAWSQDFWVKWERERVRKKISARYILSEKKKIYSDLKKEKYVELRLKEMETPVGVDVYGRKAIIILHYQEPVSCTVIFDEHTAISFKSFFEVLWQSSKSL